MATVWLVVVLICAVFANLLPVKDPLTPDVINKLALPGPDHWLGTDGLGRDTLARLVHGARVSVTISVTAVAIGMVVGGFLGIIAGFFRGRTETILMTIINIILAFPALVLLLVLLAFVGRSLVVDLADRRVPLHPDLHPCGAGDDARRRRTGVRPGLADDGRQELPGARPGDPAQRGAAGGRVRPGGHGRGDRRWRGRWPSSVSASSSRPRPGAG